MKLTGKAEELFGYWYRNPLGTDEARWTDWNNIDLYDICTFNMLDDSMKFGVYVDFFDSVGVTIEICKMPSTADFYFMVDDDDGNDLYFPTRQEARTKAIEKANEILNERL